MIYLYISTFGNDISWIKFPGKIPVEVGSACRDSKHLLRYPTNRDDIGENISLENPYYGELTGLYYIWKNNKFDSQDIIGFAHYNKVLSITPKKLNQLFSLKKKWVTSEAGTMIAHKYPSDIHILMKVLKSYFPKYYMAWNHLYLDNGASRNHQPNCEGCQLFFTTRDEFNKYCDFLFGVLAEVRKEIGNVDRVAYHRRYCAFLGERLLSVYLYANHIKAQHVQTIYPGETKLGIFLQREIRKHNLKFISKFKIVRTAKRFLVGKRHSSYK